MLLFFPAVLFAAFASTAFSQIPVTDPTVLAKCGACHRTNASGIMARVSYARTSPEGWQNVLKQMVLRHDMDVTPEEARTIVRYLSTKQGLAPEEAKPLMYGPERRIHDEQRMGIGLVSECGRCHSLSQPLLWRRPREDWQEVANTHAAQYKILPKLVVLDDLAKKTILDSAEWKAWSSTTRAPQVTGRWLIRANLPGKGLFVGELAVTPSTSPDEFNTRAVMKSVRTGAVMQRTGRAAVYTGYAWRGRSKGTSAAASPDDPANEVREVMWFSPDQSNGEGRWFWGQYQEFGFDVTLRRPTQQPVIFAVQPSAVKPGAGQLHIHGDGFSEGTSVTAGPAVVKRIVSRSANEIVADVEVPADTKVGKYEVAVGSARAPLVVYDHVDYVKIFPESAVATFTDTGKASGYKQFEVTGYSQGPDGEKDTPDDLELNPMDADWSMELVYAPSFRDFSTVGTIKDGLFSPSSGTSHINFDIWVTATAQGMKDPAGSPMSAQAWLVLTVPSYSIGGRRYVRDLDRWVDDGPSN